MPFFFSSRRRHTRWTGDWSSDVCSSDLYREVCQSPARSETPCTHADTSRGNREIPGLPRAAVALGRIGKSKEDRKSTRLNSSHPSISYAVFCLKKKNTQYPCTLLLARPYRSSRATFQLPPAYKPSPDRV